MSPAEKNARQLIVLAQRFPSGATSDELRVQTALPGPAFYEAFRFAKEQRWLVLRLDDDRLVYLADLQAVPLEELPDEGLSDWSSGSNANGVAVSNLAQIVNDNTVNMRQRIKAAGAILGYKVQDNGVTEFVKRFLESVCANVDIPTDHRIEAGELLRRSEDAKIMPLIERPAPVRTDSAEEPPIPLLELVRQRRERADRMQAEMIRQYGWVDNSSGGNRSGD
jgi:hypothetical protein